MFEGTGEVTAMSPLERETVKVTVDSMLGVDTLLGDVEVLDIEKIPLANGSDKGTGEPLLAFRGGVEGEVDGDQVGLVGVQIFGAGSRGDERWSLAFVSRAYR